VIFEFKVAAKEDGLDAACEKALKQVEEKKYTAKWESHGYKNIVKYGIGFYKKRCKIMKG
ncbi:MAG: PD-(D/E)XK nuclease domain-containing protein, partial [Chitinispirillales bacterium]|nr:PD-(D/E)XK nuclease domain-containing protein [Chitinispirillales bacterium]